MGDELLEDLCFKAPGHCVAQQAIDVPKITQDAGFASYADGGTVGAVPTENGHVLAIILTKAPGRSFCDAFQGERGSPRFSPSSELSSVWWSRTR